MDFVLREPEDLGRAILEFRASRGVTQAELAERANLHRTYLSGLEQGVSPTYVQRYFDLLNELGLQITISMRENS